MENVIKFRKSYPPVFKTKVVLEMLKQDKTMEQICRENGIHATQAHKWKSRALKSLESVFSLEFKTDKGDREKDDLIADLYGKIGQLTYEIEWLKKRWDIPLNNRMN